MTVSLFEPNQGVPIECNYSRCDQIEENESCEHENHEREPSILPNPQNIEPCNRPDNHEDKEHIHEMRKLEERRRIGHGTYSRHASGQCVIDHDGGYCNERNRRSQNQVRKGIDSTPENSMMLKDF